MTSQISYIPNVLSDHSGLYMCIEIKKNTRGVGYWKFNVFHLEKTEFREKVRDFIINITDRYSYLQPIDKWERIKAC